jgi:solute carrier family 25 carnitine/acylcarnitine transporter 20/29
MYFMTYELVQRVLTQHSKSGEIGVLSTIFAGGSAGIANWLVAMPADVLKSRLQTGRHICFEVLGDELIFCDGYLN